MSLGLFTILLRFSLEKRLSLMVFGLFFCLFLCTEASQSHAPETFLWGQVC